MEMVLAPGTRHSASRAGFSLLEVLIAMALMGLMLVGVLPLFTKSMSNNVEGGQLTEVTNFARLHLEQLKTLPFADLDLEVPAGETELLTTDLWSSVSETWIDEASFPAGEDPPFSRTTRVRQFNNSSLIPGDLELTDDEALAGGTATPVHFKEILVKVNSGRPSFLGLMGHRKGVTLRLVISA